MEEDSSIPCRVIALRDIALGVSKNKNSRPDPKLTPACYDSTVDSLLALHEECSQTTGLNKNGNVATFLGKCKYDTPPIVHWVACLLDRAGLHTL